MAHLHNGIVLRTLSAYKRTVTLLDEQYGKIEGLVYAQKHQLFHGALISYSLKKKGMSYILSNISLIDMPTYWSPEQLLFFHHVLELGDYFLPWDEHASETYELLTTLYADPYAVTDTSAQKNFLYHFFRSCGMHPEPHDTLDGWILQCIREHPQAASLQTASYLKIMESA